MTDNESPAGLRTRAETLRWCAQRARTAARAMGTYPDGEVMTATASGDGLIRIGPNGLSTERC